MTRRLILACAGLALAAPVAAQTIDQDVKCMMVSNVFATQEKDPQRKQVAQASALYYFGRVDARLPVGQLQAKILALRSSLTKDNIGPTMNGCAKQLTDRQRALQAVAQNAPTGPAKK